MKIDRLMLRWMQDYPHFLELIYRTTYASLLPFRRWLAPGSWADRWMVRLERASKGALFDCRMCGHCILHSTGMTCPMTCPKDLRNGPCGGVLLNGNCEIYPEKACVWVLAWERSKQMPAYGKEITHIQPPVNHRLQGTSAWINELHLQKEMTPEGWE